MLGLVGTDFRSQRFRVWILHLHVEGRPPARGGLTRFSWTAPGIAHILGIAPSCRRETTRVCWSPLVSCGWMGGAVPDEGGRVWIIHLHVEGRPLASGGLTRFHGLRMGLRTFSFPGDELPVACYPWYGTTPLLVVAPDHNGVGVLPHYHAWCGFIFCLCI